MYWPFRYCFDKRSCCLISLAHCWVLPHSTSLSTSFYKWSNASDPWAEKLSSPCRDLRTDEEHTARTLCRVLLLIGSKLLSQQYCWYWWTMRSDIIVLITLGVFMISPVDNFRSFSPQGTSWITCGLVMKETKCSNCAGSVLIPFFYGLEEEQLFHVTACGVGQCYSDS